MKSFIVLHQNKYQDQKKQGVLNCPQKDMLGNIPHYYSRMTEIIKGDCFYHYQSGHFVAISIAQDSVFEVYNYSSNSFDFQVPVIYYEFKSSLHIRTHWEEMINFLPSEYSPFQINGHDNSGYLYPCSESLSGYLLTKIAEINEDPVLEVVIHSTEAKITSKMRIGHQAYKGKLLELWNNECAICKIKLSQLLKASHSKPWKDSSDTERVDPYNGLLLCAHHDALYDQGFITVNREGVIKVSPILKKDNYNIFNLYEGEKIDIFEENKNYLSWHSSYVFKK